MCISRREAANLAVPFIVGERVLSPVFAGCDDQEFQFVHEAEFIMGETLREKHRLNGLRKKAENHFLRG